MSTTVPSISPRAAGAALNSFRRRFKIACAVCGTATSKRDARARYCSGKCRQKAKRERAKAERVRRG